MFLVEDAEAADRRLLELLEHLIDRVRELPVPSGYVLADSGTGELFSAERVEGWLTLAVTEGVKPDGSLPESGRSSRWEATCPMDFAAEDLA